MNMRKIVVVGGMAAGAAFVLAPLASADPAADPLAPIVASEVASMNFLFGTDTFLAGVKSADIVPGSGTGSAALDTIAPSAVSEVQGTGTTPTLFDYLVYGLDPIKAGLASDPGAFSVYNGAMVPFDDGINSLLYAMMNDGAKLGWDGGTGDLFGGTSMEHIADGASTGWAEASSYFQYAWGDLTGFFGIFPAS